MGGGASEPETDPSGEPAVTVPELPGDDPSILSETYFDWHPPLKTTRETAERLVKEMYSIPVTCEHCLGAGALILSQSLAASGSGQFHLFSPSHFRLSRTGGPHSLFNLIKTGALTMTAPSGPSPLRFEVTSTSADPVEFCLAKGSVFEPLLITSSPISQTVAPGATVVLEPEFAATTVASEGGSYRLTPFLAPDEGLASPEAPRFEELEQAPLETDIPDCHILRAAPCRSRRPYETRIKREGRFMASKFWHVGELLVSDIEMFFLVEKVGKPGEQWASWDRVRPTIVNGSLYFENFDGVPFEVLEGGNREISGKPTFLEMLEFVATLPVYDGVRDACQSVHEAFKEKYGIDAPVQVTGGAIFKAMPPPRTLLQFPDD
jgi:hypothetical protein